MTRTSRSWAIAATAFLAAAPVLAGCAAGFDANTIKPYAPTEAKILSSGDIHISQAFILGPDSGATLPAGGSAPMYLSVVNTNRTTDTLVAATAEGASGVQVAAPISLPQNQRVNTGVPTPQITVQGLAKPLTGGEHVNVKLQFTNAGVVDVILPVITRSREFASLAPAQSAAPSDTAPSDTAPSGTATATPTDGATAPATPAETPTGTPTDAPEGAPTATPTDSAAGH
ncbi:hypothetical protein Misp01_55560 [Microtetraspora sp. NBRC 13810]|uniref:copper chaperone PCu(A)C n=1 Tax=Microtetraspora sp. NBRC 13810 TaxID=3030990 RepID=UPI0024A371EF|nr:copper chaperone PCu(A)C [Microtetraspora sp. NBRC 13810]GLW10428.1 hypothetical protein Misp01_55560 [Microtetraspora sp. NBRC 13810]